MLQLFDKPNLGSWIKIFTAFAMIFCLAMDLYGLKVLAHSPSIGAQFKAAEGRLLLHGEDRVDTAETIQGRHVGSTYFLEDPFMVRSWDQYGDFREWSLFLDSLGQTGFLDIGLRNQEELSHSRYPARPLGYHQAIKRSFPLFVVSWAFLLIAFLIWRRRQNEVTFINFLGGIGVFLCLSSSKVFYLTDLWIHPISFQALGALNWITSQSAILTLHLGLILPTPSVWIQRHPWLRIIPWVLFLAQIPIHGFHWLPGPFFTTYLLCPLALLGLTFIILFRLYCEREPQVFQQTLWVALGIVVGFMPWILLSVLPLTFGFQGIPQQFTLLFFGLAPLCIAFAIMRYRLLDVGYLFDLVLVHGLTLGILTVGELFLWAFLSNGFSEATPIKSYLFIAFMAFVVLFYAPIRMQFSKKILRLTGKMRPPIPEIIQHLLQSANELKNPSKAFHQTLFWALRPSEIHEIQNTPEYEPIFTHLEKSPGGLIGADLGEDCPIGMASAVIFPVMTHGKSFALALLPSNRSGWSRSDLELMNTIARTAEPLITIQQLNKEHRATELALRKQQEEVLREMHDGLGSQLFGLSLLSKIPENPQSAILINRMSEIALTTSDAMDSLRTGLTVLGSPPGAFGPCMLTLLMRTERLFELSGIQLVIDIHEDITTLQLDSHKVFGLMRAMQEALTNIIKHSQAQTAWVKADLRMGRLQIQIQDQGIGFSSDTTLKGNGIPNMVKRMKLLGGQSQIHSGMGDGTQILLEVPL